MTDHIVDANKLVRAEFEAWAHKSPANLAKDAAGGYQSATVAFAWRAVQATTQRQQERIMLLEVQIAELQDAARINFENYEFQRRKADAATASVYQFHHALSDAGWHPGRTDDNLCDIIRAKGKEFAELEAQVQALRLDAGRLDYLQRHARSDPKMDGNHVWWPTSFNQAQNLKGPTLREAIDAAIDVGKGGQE